jgi:hypothetical protein
MALLLSFIPNEVDLAIYQGGTIIVGCTCVDLSGNPVNMTGGSIQVTIRAAQSNSSTLIATPTVTWINQAAGIFNISLTDAQTEALSFSSAYWDAVYVDGNTPPNVLPLFFGTVTMQATENATY